MHQDLQHTVVGIDVSKNTLDCNVSGQPDVTTFTYDTKGLDALVKKVRSHDAPLVVMEATGRYERRLADHLVDHDIAASVVNPRDVRYFARAHNQLAKTDAIDARMITRFGQQMDCPRYRKPSAAEAKLQACITRREQAVGMRTAESNRLQQTDDAAMRTLIRHSIAMFDRQIARIDAMIDAVTTGDEDMRRRRDILESVPGIGRQTAAMLIAALPELGSVGRNQIARLIGVAPTNRDSGTMRGRRTTGGGRVAVRTALYMPIVSATRWNPVIRARYKHLRQRGKPAKVALVACLRKLIITLNAMIRDQRPWTPVKA